MLDPTRALAIDRSHVWHPYGSAAGAPAHFVDSAKGVHLRLVDSDGTRREVVDGMASWWCAIHGYAVPELDAAARGQLDSMSHVMFGGLTHAPAIGLVERLVAMTPEPLTRVFLADSGSVSVEVAMKMALQAQIGRGERGRTRFLTIRGGYHGDTFSPMSVTDPDGGMHSLWKGTLPEHVFAPRPPRATPAAETDLEFAAWAAHVRELTATHAHTLAAVIIEPVLQGAGGMHPYSPEAVALLAEVAREHGLLVIHDEIATGFWRTGTRWASEAAGVVPDIMCIGKALTGGYLTLAATLTSEEVAAAVSDPRAGGGLMHGPTFMGNPLACAVASASIDLLHAGDPTGTVARIGDRLATGLTPLRSAAGVVDVRTIGAVGVLQLDRPVDMAAATRAALDAGVWLRPFRDLVYAMPPYACTDADVDTIVAGMAAVAVGHAQEG